jgi:magnesium-transporting ATPase (P-type)
MSVVASLSCPSGRHTTSGAPHTGLSGLLGLVGGGEGEEGLGGKEVGVGHYVSGDNKQQSGQASPHDTITEHFISMKGSPESVFTCLSSQQRQDKMFRARYFAEFERLARQGKRVIAFASKSVSVQCTISSMSRQDAEENLHFQGFVSFACPIRYTGS